MKYQQQIYMEMYHCFGSRQLILTSTHQHFHKEYLNLYACINVFFNYNLHIVNLKISRPYIPPFKVHVPLKCHTFCPVSHLSLYTSDWLSNLFQFFHDLLIHSVFKTLKQESGFSLLCSELQCRPSQSYEIMLLLSTKCHLNPSLLYPNNPNWTSHLSV